MLYSDLLRRNAARFPHRTALAMDDGSDARTYAELHQRAMRLANGLSGLASPGDRVALLSENNLEYVEAYYGVPAAGSVPQFIGHIIGKSLGVTMNSVPYKGGAPMVQDLLAGQIPIGIASMTELIEYHRAGKVRILASSGQERSKTAPEIPTFLELGYSGIDKNPWLAFFGPKGLPAEFVEQFDRAMKTVLAQPDLQEKLAKMGNEVTAAPSKEVEQWVVDASRGWGKVIRDSGFKAQ